MRKKFCYFIVAILLTGCGIKDPTPCATFLNQRDRVVNWTFNDKRSVDLLPQIDSNIHRYCSCDSTKVYRLP